MNALLTAYLHALPASIRGRLEKLDLRAANRAKDQHDPARTALALDWMMRRAAPFLLDLALAGELAGRLRALPRIGFPAEQAAALQILQDAPECLAKGLPPGRSPPFCSSFPEWRRRSRSPCPNPGASTE